MYKGHKVAVVMPVHNEQAHISRAIERVPAFVDLIVAVDDGSTDQTRSVLARMRDERLTVIRHERNRGVGAATKTGYKHSLAAGADLIAVMDGDGQMDGTELHRLLDRAIDGVDYVKGNRFLNTESVRAMPRIRYVGNRLFSWLARRAASFNGSLDAHCGYTVIRRQALKLLALDELYDRYGFPSEMFFASSRAGLSFESVAVRTIYGDEVSGINPFTAVPAVMYLTVRAYARRRFGSGDNKPKLLLLTSSFPRSPDDETCGYIRDFARSLSSRFEVTVLAPPDRGALRWPRDSFTLIRSRSVLPLALDSFQAGADLNHLQSRNWLAKLAALISIVSFFTRAFVLALGADAICSHWLVPSGLVGALIARMLGKPHIVVEHSGALHLLGRMRGGRRLASFITGGSRRVITVSRDLKRKLIAICPEAAGKIEVSTMGITAGSAGDSAIRNSQFAILGFGADGKSQASNLRTILFIGRLTEVKALDLLLEAMNGLDDVQLIVAGDGEKRNDLEQMSQKLLLRARFIGQVDAAARRALFSICDAVVIPSRVLADGRTEGTPVVCLEALAAGCVVVAARVGGLAETIVDGQNGLLFDPDDHLKLRQKLLLALEDRELRQALIENARRSGAGYDWSLVGARFGEMITSSLDHPKRAFRVPTLVGSWRSSGEKPD